MPVAARVTSASSRGRIGRRPSCPEGVGDAVRRSASTSAKAARQRGGVETRGRRGRARDGGDVAAGARAPRPPGSPGRASAAYDTLPERDPHLRVRDAGLERQQGAVRGRVAGPCAAPRAASGRAARRSRWPAASCGATARGSAPKNSLSSPASRSSGAVVALVEPGRQRLAPAVGDLVHAPARRRARGPPSRSRRPPAARARRRAGECGTDQKWPITAAPCFSAYGVDAPAAAQQAEDDVRRRGQRLVA